jgi:FlaA1/EpsC-like NDP-sugar epimerase/lipopolysaccharide/colanic/teichoic acid biosynthesis glycosyltransferase
MGPKRTPRYLLLAIGYGAIVNLAYLAALLLRFDGEVPARFWAGYRAALPAFTVLSLAGYYAVGLFHSLWRYASTVTLFQILKGATLSAVGMVLIMVFSPELLFPASLIVTVWLWQVALVGGARFGWRLARERVLGPGPRRALRTLIVGADSRGVHLAQEMQRAVAVAEPLSPVGFIDDDPRLSGRLIEGLKVFGTVADLPRVLSESSAEMVIVSDPGVPARGVREIARFCADANVRVKTLPGLADLHQGRPRLAQVRDMRIEDLLGREPVQLDLGEVAEFVRGERVLVTGAGGSIGSELARQVAEHGPSELILLDHSENGLYYVHNELLAQRAGLPVHPVIGDIQDLEGMEVVFKRFRPTLVLHAAAHKHVPLLEANPREAVLNNITGTRHLVQLSDRHGVRKFVLISTDKAVNPTSVMGASKRVCEMLLQSRSQTSTTRFVAVRFGNVLGSDGSVIPLFQRQLERGGPITVTHPDARRYFMTIPEAVRLVLQAGAMGRGGDVFLLEMGEQVRILDLARQVIQLAGLREGEDIEIVFTGLRPGEKLYEELQSDGEKTRMTRHERIIKWELDVCDEEQLLRDVDALERIAQTGDMTAIRRGLARLVPEFSEAPVMPIEAPPATPVVELPAATPIPTGAQRYDWPRLFRRAGVSAVAALALALSAPLWALLWLEARGRGQREMLTYEMRVGRTRRRQPRHPLTAGATKDRRAQDLLGEPLRCARFRSDLGWVSRWAARHHLDQLPFLLNVLRGQMTLVGPKPERGELVRRWQNLVPDYARRFTVLPGVTGLAQVSECTDSDADGVVRRVHYDLFYIDNRSLLLDVRTLGRTLGVLARRPRAGAAPLATAPGGEPAVKGVTR